MFEELADALHAVSFGKRLERVNQWVDGAGAGAEFVEATAEGDDFAALRDGEEFGEFGGREAGG